MDVTKNELGNILAEKGFKNTAFYHFAQKLFLINPNFNQDDVVFIIEGLSEEMKTKIVSNYKKDKLNGVSGEDIEKKINEYDSQFLDEANPAEPEISDDADVTGEEIEINPADNNKKKEEKNVDSINVQIVGEVKVPGAFKVKQGTTVSELIDVAGGLTDAADQAFIPFLKVLEAEEKIEVPVKLIKVYIHGGVKNEGIFNIPSNGSIDDAVRMADGFSDTADPSMIDYTIKLKDGCNITIPEKQELFADISGAVKNPGYYKISENERLGQLVDKAGGLLPDADRNGINLSSLIKDSQKIIIPLKGEGEVVISNAAENDKEEGVKEKIENDNKSQETSVPEHSIAIKHNNETYFATPVPVKTDKEKKYYFNLFRWIKSCIFNNVRRLPKSVQNLLEGVEDPVKLNVLTKGFNDGLSVDKLKSLLTIQKDSSVEKLQELVRFYIELETTG